jgi:hypothetical protein
MMDFVYGVDEWLIGRAERVSHFLQRTFGVVSGDLVRLFCMMALAFLLKLFISDHGVFDKTMDVIMMLIRIGTFIESYGDWRATQRELANPLKVRHRGVRVSYVAFSVLSIYTDVLNFQLWFQCVTLADYFLACDDLPPGESRVRKLLREIGASGKLQVPIRVSEN